MLLTAVSRMRVDKQSFHVYVCAVLLKTLRDHLLKLPFQDLVRSMYMTIHSSHLIDRFGHVPVYAVLQTD